MDNDVCYFVKNCIMKEELLSRTVAALVTEDYRTADVFKKHGIDFCCGGKVTLQDTCKRKNIDPAVLIEELSAIGSEVDAEHDFASWEADRLAHYITDKHHAYVRENLDLIRQYADKVAQVHGGHRPEVREIAVLYARVADELSMHLRKEEVVLFPYIEQLVELKRKNLFAERPPFGTVGNPIRMMEQEHDLAGDIFHRIAELSDHYNPPAEACNTYRVLYAKLREFEEDLHMHVHLENNILFPKALELERERTAALN